MGLFDRRDDKNKGDEFDSPVETIDLNAPPADPEPAPSELAPPPPDDPEPADYGIEHAIELMRTLPQDNVELVVQVVKHTLESTRIKIPRIIDDASQKQQDIEARMKLLREEIEDLDKEIAARRFEIETLEADYEETTAVKERLVLAEKLGKGGGQPQPRGKAEAPRPQRPPRPSEPPPRKGTGQTLAETTAKK